MARPRGFDTEELLDNAGLAFLETGFQLTSMRQLEKSTGVKQVSLYNAFGSKEGLFLAAFDRYTAMIEEFQRRFLDNKRSRKQGIVALARKLLTALGKYIREGEIPAGARLKKGPLRHTYMPSLSA